MMPAAQLAPAEGLFESRPVGGDHARLRWTVGLPPERRVDDPQLLGVEVDLAQQRVNRELFVGGEMLIGQPAAALDPEQVRRWAARDQIAGRMACTWFFSRVRWRTMFARLATCRRNACVASSATHTDGR
jgi:hypothetical protein